MTPQRVAVGKVVIALSIVALVLAALLGLFLVTSESMVKTATITVVPTQQAVEMVSGIFAQHVLSFTSGNVSEIMSQYASNANVTWTGHGGKFCFAGLYFGSNILTLFGVFFRQVAPAVAMGNVTRTVTAETNGSVVVDSNFDFVAHGVVYGIVNGTVSAQDSYEYSTKNGAWQISQETWDFVTFNPQNFSTCIFGDS